jgi:hypothetical protein
VFARVTAAKRKARADRAPGLRSALDLNWR